MPTEAIRRLRLRFRLLTIGYIAIVAALAFGFHQRNVDLGRLTTQNCRGLERVKTTIRQSQRRALKTIPTISYYKHHPAERKRALAQVRESLRQFRARPCP